MEKVVTCLKKIATELESKGRPDYADYVSQISASVDQDLQETLASEEAYVKSAVDECAEADQEISAAMRVIEAASRRKQDKDASTEDDSVIEAARQVIAAARKRKKKWIGKIDLKKGRFTEYCKGQGFDGPCQACAEKALNSPDKSVRGMAGFYRASQKFRKKKKD